jgi:hypothetical protein
MGKKYDRAARYALYPHELGLCGPSGQKGKLHEYLTLKGKVSDREARTLLDGFLAATAYLTLIAASNEIEDWLDPRVVDAYWIGNDLLNRVRSEDLKELVLGFSDVGRMTRAVAEETAARVHYDHRPHHSFHVFVVGGITGKVEAGTAGWELCRIGWGRVLGVDNDDATLAVLARSLRRNGGKVLPEMEMGERECAIRRDSQILPHVKVGDIVSFHWGRAVEVIDHEAARRLEYWTERTLRHCQQQT